MKEKENLWIVTELYYPEETSTGYYLTRIAQGLSAEFKTKVVCGQPNYFSKGVHAEKFEIHKNVEINRVWGTTLDKNVILFRLINMLTLSFFVFWKLFRKLEKGDKILVVTTPPSLPLIAAAAALIRNAGYTLLIHDNYPEILIASGKVKEDSIFVKICEYLNRWIFKYASKIIVVGRDMSKLVAAKTEGLDVPIAFIPNWAELETVRPLPKKDNTLLSELKLQNKFIFLYAGNMGYPNDLESIVESVRMLDRENTEIHFIFLGNGVKKKWLVKICSEYKLKNVTILDPKPRTEQSIFLNACDVGFVSLVKKMRGVSMPSRTYNILAAGKPILALTENDSEIDLMLKEDQTGWCVMPNDPSELTKIIKIIYNNRGKLAQMGEKAELTANKKYSEEKILDQYISELKMQ